MVFRKYNINPKLILLIIFLSLLQNIGLFTDNVAGWDSLYHIGQAKIIYNEGSTTFISPINFGIPFYNESPLVFYFTAYFAKIFHLNIDSVIKYIPLFFAFTTLIALYYFFRLFLKSEKEVCFGLIIFSFITLPIYYAPCDFLLFAILSLYFTYKIKNTLSYTLIGITLGISFLIHAPTAFILTFIILILIVYKYLRNMRQMLKALVIVGSIYLLIMSITLIPAYYRETVCRVPTQDSFTLSIKEEIEVTVPNIGIGEELNTPYLKKLKFPNMLFFYQGCVGLFLLSIYGIYTRRKEVIPLIIPFISLILLGNIKYFSDKPFIHLIYFSIPLAVMGITSFKYKKTLTIIFIGYLLLFASKAIYLSMDDLPQENKYVEVSKVLSEGIILTDPETRFYLTYHLGTTQCYPLNKNLKDYNKREVKRGGLSCLRGINMTLLEKEDIKYIVVTKNPQYKNNQTLSELKGFNLDVRTFQNEINSVDWTQYGYSLAYEDEYVRVFRTKR